MQQEAQWNAANDDIAHLFTAEKVEFMCKDREDMFVNCTNENWFPKTLFVCHEHRKEFLQCVRTKLADDSVFMNVRSEVDTQAAMRMQGLSSIDDLVQVTEAHRAKMFPMPPSED